MIIIIPPSAAVGNKAKKNNEKNENRERGNPFEKHYLLIQIFQVMCMFMCLPTFGMCLQMRCFAGQIGNG